MKKFIVLLLAVLLCFSLCACGEKNDDTQNDKGSSTESISSAPFLDLDLMYNIIETNEAQANLNYNKKMFKVKVTVMNIGTDRFSYRYKNYRGETKSFDVHMPMDVLATLSNGSHIIVYGKLILSGSYASLHDAILVDESNIGEQSFDDSIIQDAIANFKPFNSDGNIDWNAGSAPFFVENRLYFEKLTSETFLNEMSGEWKGKYYSERNTEYHITFTSDSTASVSKDDKEASEWSYTFSGDMINFPNNSSVEAREVRKVSDKLVVIYADTIDYVPYWILYKE